MALEVKSFADLGQITDGMIFLGCDEPETWNEGLRKLWNQEGWMKIAWFDNPFVLITTGDGRTSCSRFQQLIGRKMVPSLDDWHAGESILEIVVGFLTTR